MKGKRGLLVAGVGSDGSLITLERDQSGFWLIDQNKTHKRVTPRQVRTVSTFEAVMQWRKAVKRSGGKA